MTQENNNKNQTDDQKSKPRQQFDKYIKYSNIAIQMGVIIGLGVWGGIELDEYFNTSKPYFTIALSLFSVTAAIIIVIRSVLND